MPDPSKPPLRDPIPDLQDLDRRLRAQRDEHEKKHGARSAGSLTTLSIAWRISSEFVAAVFVGLAIGFGIDWLAGWTPWATLVGLVFGFAAGVLNVTRAAEKMNAAAAAALGGAPHPSSPEDEEDACGR